jgi:putative hemolysin
MKLLPLLLLPGLLGHLSPGDSKLTPAELNPQIQVYQVNSIKIKLAHVERLHLLISPNCLDPLAGTKKGSDSCEAIQKLKTVSLKNLGPELAGGANPGSAACLKMGGQVFISLDSKSNQNSVCQFKDGSIVSSGTLHYYAQINDSRRK